MVERVEEGFNNRTEVAKRLTEQDADSLFQEEYGAARQRERNGFFPEPMPLPRPPKPFTMEEVIDRGGMAIESIEKLFKNVKGSDSKSCEPERFNDSKQQHRLEQVKPRLTPHTHHSDQSSGHPAHDRRDLKGDSGAKSDSQDEGKATKGKLQLRNLFLPLEDILK